MNRLVSALFALVVAGSSLSQTATPPPIQGGGNTQPPATQEQPKTSKEILADRRMKDKIDQLRDAYMVRSKKAKDEDKIESVSPLSATVGRKVAFRAQGKLKNTIASYSLEGAPEGAAIEESTGLFTWTPKEIGKFEFILIASAPEDPERNVRTLITIEVKEGLKRYGYDFFIAPRAAITARLNAFAQGGAKPTVPVAPSAAAAGTEAKPETNPPVNANPPANTNPPANSTDVQNPAKDPLRQIVGPFDMLNSNIMIPAPDRYQVGPGDMLVIRYSSPALETVEKEVRVDSQGGVTNPVTGRRIVVRSQTLLQVEKTLQGIIGKEIRGADVTVTLKELRSMQITVLGEAFLPGSYQVPSVATLFNVLYMVGGPNDNGSLRRIELRRSDGSRRMLDLYRFLITGDSKQDVALQPGDAIYIPAIESEVTVSGEVGRSAIYETISGEKLSEVLKMAGGVKASGVNQRISLRTVAPGQGLRQLDIDLRQNTPDSNPPVYGGDQIEVFAVRPVITNSVTLEGAVDQPGLYQVTEKLTVSGLISRARGVIPEAHLERADLFRRNPDGSNTLIPINLAKALQGDKGNDLAIMPYDRVVVYRVDETKWMGTRQVAVLGAVRRPGVFARADGMTVLDLLLQAGGLDGEASQDEAFLQRRNPDGSTGDLLRIDFRKAAAGDAAHNVVLQDQDELRVQTTAEVKYRPDQQVRILGAVQKPGEYAAAANLSLKDLIALAGGTLPQAGKTVEIAKSRVPQGTAPSRHDLADVLSGKTEVRIDAGDLITIPETSNFVDRPGYVIVMGAVGNPGYYAVNPGGDKVADVITRAGGLTKKAFAMGTQFYRIPAKLKTPAIDRLSPRIKEVLEIVAQDEYNRAKAHAEVDRARLIKNINSGQATISLSGTPAATQSTGPNVEIKGDTVTKARTMDKSDLEMGGNLNINLPDAMRRPSTQANLPLEEGDIIWIPETPSTVNIVGAVVVPSSLIFVPGKNLGHYVDQSGGFLRDADEKSVLVIRANGAVIKATRRTRIELGDHVFVPTRVVAERLTDRQAEIDSITRNVTSAGVLFAVLKSLLGK